MSPLLFAIVFAVAFGSVVLLTPLAIRLGKRWQIVDRPGGRRKHKGEIVRLGGLSIYPGFLLATLVTLWLGIPREDPLEIVRLTGVLVGMGVVWVTGLLDDIYKLPPWAQAGGITIAAAIAIACKVFIEVFNSPFTDEQIFVEWYLMLPISFLWLTGMTSTINMIDGLDGLAAGVTAIAAGVLFVHMVRLNQYSVSLLPLALVGCCLGFLIFNFHPARIFLGGGAYVLGFGLASLSIVAGAKVASALLVLWLPIVDALWQIYSRWRRKQSIVLGDRGHLHLRLQDLGWPQQRIVLLYYTITAVLGALALLSPSRTLKLVILAGGGLAFLAFIVLIGRISGDDIPTGT